MLFFAQSLVCMAINDPEFQKANLSLISAFRVYVGKFLADLF